MAIIIKFISKGIFNNKSKVRQFLSDEPASYPNCSGTRTYNDNRSDLKPTIAANQKAAQLLGVLVEEYTLPVVHFYTDQIKLNQCKSCCV